MPTTLRILEGPDKGSQFDLTLAEITVGRGAKAQVKLKDPDISWEHLLITKTGEDWMIENLSAHGTLINEQKISGKTRLRSRDRIRIGDHTLLRFETTDGSQSAVLGNPWVLRGVGLIVGLLVIAWIASVLLQKPAPVAHFPEAHKLLLNWLTQEANAGHVSPDVPQLFSEARRLELAASAQPEPTDKTGQLFKSAAARYQKLLLLIDDMEERYHCMANAAEQPRALDNLMQALAANPDADAGADEKGAALVEFVKLKLKLCNANASK